MQGAPDPACTIKELSRAMRKNPTQAENKLWQALRCKKLGFKFRRKFVIDSKYIEDFVCLEKRLIIECEEDDTQSPLPQHEGRLDFYLESQNFRILRFLNSEILEDLEGVLRVIKEALESSEDFANAKSTHTKAPPKWMVKREKSTLAGGVWGGVSYAREGGLKSSKSAMEAKKNVLMRNRGNTTLKQHSKTKKVLTDEQECIVDLSKRMDKNEILAIQACAGSGKTSTLEEIALANPKQRFLYLAFNKSIATEAKERFPKNVEARTIHSLAFAYARVRLGSFAPQGKITILDLKELVEFDFKYADNYDLWLGLKIFENFLKSDKTLDDCFDKKFIKFLYEATLEGKIPLTRDFVKKFYQIEKKAKYDDIDFDKALEYAREKLQPDFVIAKTYIARYIARELLSKKLGIVDKLNIFNLSNVLRFKCGFGNIQTGLDKFNKFLKSKESLNEVKNETIIEYLFQATLDKKLPITHDFYLKYYQMWKDKRLEEKYDFILLDEAQDTNEIMLDIFLENDCKKIFVGDTFQSIYEFNNSINAFEIVETNHHLSLSQSFRCKQEILDYAMFFLRVFADKDFMQMRSGFSGDERITTRAFISRTNAGIARFLVDLYKSDSFEHKEYRLLKDPDSIFEPIWAIVYFKSSQFDKISKRYSYIKDFSSFKELREYIEEIEDVELKQAMKLLGEFKDIQISEIQTLAQSLYANKNAKNTITNAHQSKGLEWDEVILGGDFFDLYEKQLEARRQKEWEKFQQELNLFYVAITRAKKRLIDESANAELYMECNDWYHSDVLILK